MQPTRKYDTMIGESINHYSGSPINDSRQQISPAPATKNFDVIAAEVRAIIMKAYETDENKNIHS